jgi:hypothetical protein
MPVIPFPYQRQSHTAAQLGMDVPRPRAATQIGAPQARTACHSSARVFELFRHRPGDVDHRDAANVTRSPWCRSRPKGRSPARSLHRRTSGPEFPEFRVDNRRASGLPLQLPRGRTSSGADCRQRPAPHPINRVALSIGLGVAIRRNRWPHCLGFRIGPPSDPTRGSQANAARDATHIYRRQPP